MRTKTRESCIEAGLSKRGHCSWAFRMTRIKSEPEHLERGGGGRRKQSKPIRVFLSDEDLANQPSKMVESLEQTENNSHSNSDGLIEDMPRSECEMEVEDLLSCDICSESFTTQTTLMEHVQTAHTVTDENAQDSFPTKYHQLGSQFQSGTSTNNLPSLPEEGAVPKEKRDIEKNSDSQGVPCNGSKVRIFHKDAYCELCDREFCNKYFLKTHRANKHGIYDDDSPPSSVGALLQPTTPTSQEPEQLRTNSSPVNRSGSTPVMPKPHIEITPQATASMLVPTLHPPASPPKSSMSALSTPTKPMPLSRPAPTSTGKPAPDMEDYCEMCQKHFCNKYYLKKHKQDVHGIIPEASPSTSGKRGRPPMSGQISGLPMGNGPLPNSSLPNLVMPPVSGSVSNGSANIPGLGNVMLINPFAPPMLIQAPQVLGGLPSGFPQQMGVMPQMPQQGSVASESPKSTSTTSTTSVSSANVPLTNDALRGIGVLNAEAYCELCRKEFCNKYFLRIHKANKHGILIDDPDQPLPANTGGLPVLNVPNLPNAGDLPPGTINITPTSEAESQGKPEEGKMERSPVGDKEVERGEIRQHAASEEICSLCKKEFANKYSLKVHMINAHGITVPDFDLLPPKENKMKHEGQSSLQGASMFGNMMAAKLADRVMCDICNKEVCNKYFLKTHKIKVHGLDPAVAERELNAMSSGMIQGKMNSMSTGASPLKMLNKAPGQSSRSPPNDASIETTVPRPKDEDLLKMGIDPEAYCEICKKEFCSKYFLKTHKQNIHGIKSDMNICMPSAQQVPLNPMIPLSSSMNFNPKSESPKVYHTNNNNKTGMSGNNSPVSQTGSDSSMKDAHSRVVCEICNKEVCNKYFLKTHMLNKHGINTDLPGHFPPFMPGLPFPMPLSDQAPMDMPLNMFSSNFMARLHEEMSQPLDLKKPISSSSLHGGENKKASENGLKELASSAWHVPAKKEDMQLSLEKCEICGLMFGEKVTLQLHMIQDHPGQVTVSTKTNAEDKAHLSGNIVLSLKKKYQKGRRIRGHVRKLFSSNSHLSGEQSKKRFRCAYCQLRFISKLDCQAHIRKSHPKAKTINAANPTSHEQVHPEPSMVSTALPNGVDKNCKMQAFQIFSAERQEHFAPATVYLPVYEKVDQPLTMTFNLKPKPMEQ